MIEENECLPDEMFENQAGQLEAAVDSRCEDSQAPERPPHILEEE
jgi:hypothetical protein